MNIYPRVMTVKSAEMLAKEMAIIGVSPEGIDLMVGKGVFRAVKLENVPLKATLLIKQEMLAKGGGGGAVQGGCRALEGPVRYDNHGDRQGYPDGGRYHADPALRPS